MLEINSWRRREHEKEFKSEESLKHTPRDNKVEREKSMRSNSRLIIDLVIRAN